MRQGAGQEPGLSTTGMTFARPAHRLGMVNPGLILYFRALPTPWTAHEPRHLADAQPAAPRRSPWPPPPGASAMSGLSAADIATILAAQGTTAATQQLIVQFLNGVASADALAGVEAQDGPIEDSPATGFGDQVRDYEIGPLVAQRILNRRSTIGGFTALTQLAQIKGLGSDKFKDLLYSFTRSVHQISGIEFNFNSATQGNDALNLRRNFSAALPAPSWSRASSVPARDSCAAYSIQATQGQPLAIRVALRANGMSAAFVRATGGGRLGPVREQLVSFDAAGESGWQTFQLDAPAFHAQGVAAFDMAWAWQWRLRAGDPWRPLLTTRHRIYVVLQAPTLPWVQTTGSSSLPWTDALDIACAWAAGATTPDAAATRVTAGYNGSGRVRYDTTSGATFYGWTSYQLTQMIARLNGGMGLGPLVNCTDSANTVSTFANLLCCDLWQSRMGWGFALNPMIAIGYSTWAIPFSGSFSYHEVAWKGACTSAEQVFDGCLKVDADADPVAAPHTPLLPTNMLFGDCGVMNYRLRLCPPAPAGCTACQPQPATTRQRRPIV